jgi:UDP-glucose 4-epimerase
MTRFMMTLDDAVDLVFFAFKHANNGDILVQKSPSATIETLARALCLVMNKPNHPIKIIGTRHGEKAYETLCSREEMASAEDLGDYYRLPPDLRDLNYGKFVEQGEIRITTAEDYHSHNAEQLDVEGMTKLLRKISFIQAISQGESAIPED